MRYILLSNLPKKVFLNKQMLDCSQKPRDHQGERVNPPYRPSNYGNPSQSIFRHGTQFFREFYSRDFPRCVFSWRKQRRRVMADRASSKRKFEVSNAPSKKRKKTSPNLFCSKERTCTLCDRNKIETFSC